MPMLIPRELVAERPATSFVGLAPHLIGLCRALTRDRPSARWAMGDPPGPPAALDPDPVVAFLRHVDEQHGHGFPERCWFSVDGDHNPPTVACTLEATAAGPIAQARCALPESVTAPALATLVRDVAEQFGATQAYVEDDVLLLRYFSRRATERARAATPPEFRDRIPDPPDLGGDVDLDLLVVHDYDRLRVPAGVFWVNYWSAALIATLGQARVRAAGWARILESASGALVLVATDEPLDPQSQLHLDRLCAILDQLRLREAQESVRYR
jgi:hypothetical protein